MPKLMLDLGLRYDYFQPVEPRNHFLDYQIFRPASDSLIPYANGSIDTNNHNFSPKIGMAYRFNDRTVFRAAYNLNYWDPSIAYESSAFSPLNQTIQVGVPSSYAVAGLLQVTPPIASPPTAVNLPTIPPPVTGVVLNQPRYITPAQVKTPYVQSWTFDIQRDLSHGILASLAFVGNDGRDLPYTRDLNSAAPGTGVAGLPFAYLGQTAPVYQRGTGFSSNYNSLQVNLTKRFSPGLAFTLAYTYSKTMDYGAGLNPFLNNSYPFVNRGPANFDQTNILTITHNWMLPFGPGTPYFNHGFLSHILGPWELDGILRYGSGSPYTPTGSAAICECPGNTPTANPAGSYAGIAGSPNPGYYGLFSYLSPYQPGNQAFGQPGVGEFGVLGRNTLRVPGFTNYDGAISRYFLFREKTRIQFRLEAYNLSNSIQYQAPISTVSSSNFGLSTQTIPGLNNRLFQAVMKVAF
jgi:hypothetical protein